MAQPYVSSFFFLLLLCILFSNSLSCATCAKTSLNAVLQGPYFDDNTLAQLTGGGAIDTYSINLALRSFNLSLQPLQSKVPQDPILLQNAFLCFHQGRWFTIRRIGAHWLNLSDFILRPAQILPWHLSTSLTQLQEDGCKVYAVSGNLPMCSADQTDFFNEHFLWYLDRGIVATDDAEEDLCDCEECEDQICDCEELAYEDTFEDDLQAAIAASLAELQLGKNGNGKPLSIKRSASPSMSMVSTVAGGVHGVSSSQSLGKREQQPPS